MAAGFHDLFAVRRLLRLGTVNFEADFQPGILGGLTAHRQSFADLFQCLVGRDVFAQAVRANLDHMATAVGDQFDKLLAGFDILLDLAFLVRMEFADRAAAPEDDAAVRELLLDLGPLVGIQRGQTNDEFGWVRKVV